MFGLRDIRLKPSQIRFSQNSIYYKFYGHSETLNDNVNAFVGLKSADDYPAMRVVIKDRKLYSLDNRRLYLFRVLESKGRIKDVPVTIRAYNGSWSDSRKFTTTNDGKTITFSDFRRRPTSECTPMYHGVYNESFPDITEVDVNESTRKEIQSILDQIEREQKEGEERAKLASEAASGSEDVDADNGEIDSTATAESEEDSPKMDCSDGNEVKANDAASHITTNTEETSPVECDARNEASEEQTEKDDSAAATVPEGVTDEDDAERRPEAKSGSGRILRSEKDESSDAEPGTQSDDESDGVEPTIEENPQDKEWMSLGQNGVKGDLVGDEKSAQVLESAQLPVDTNIASSPELTAEASGPLTRSVCNDINDRMVAASQQVPNVTASAEKIAESEKTEDGGENAKTITPSLKRSYCVDPTENGDKNDGKRPKMGKTEEAVSWNLLNNLRDSDDDSLVNESRLVTAQPGDFLDCKQPPNEALV